MQVLVATRSEHKRSEIEAIAREVWGRGSGSIELRSLTDLHVEPTVAEDHLEPYDTFEANARSKARYFRRLTGLPTLADDSGICVAALDWGPGVRTKRFAPDSWRAEPEQAGLGRDEANNRYLLHRLEEVGATDRSAFYACAAVAVGFGPEVTIRGEAHGSILKSPVGVGGFGYDPLFFDEELNLAFAEISAEEKNRRSHRGRAFRAMFRYLAAMKEATE